MKINVFYSVRNKTIPVDQPWKQLSKCIYVTLNCHYLNAKIKSILYKLQPVYSAYEQAITNLKLCKDIYILIMFCLI